MNAEVKKGLPDRKLRTFPKVGSASKYARTPEKNADGQIPQAASG
jgi:hypothetical protein